MMPERAQLAYPLDLPSRGAIKSVLESDLKDVIIRQNRIQSTIPSGATTFNVASSYMVLTGAAAVTITTIGGGREGMILSLQFTDTNITITDTGTGATNTINLAAPFTSTADGILQLQYNGISWREVGRAVAGVPSTITVANEATDTTSFIAFFTAATGDLQPKTNANLAFNSNTGVMTFGADPIIPDEAYGSGWNGVLEPPTKNAVYDKIETLTSPTVLTAIPQPNYPSTYALASGATMNSNTTGYTSAFRLDEGITINKVTFANFSAAATPGDIKFGIFSEDGQTRHCNETMNVAGTGERSFTLSAAVPLTAGNYYVVIVPVSTTSCVSRAYAAMTEGINLNDVSSEPTLLGTQTVSAGTLPTTFTPGSLTANTAVTFPIIRFDN